MTDSGGLQEEAPALGKPVLVLRQETERPEAVNAGTVKMAGTDEEEIYRLAKMLLDNKEEYENEVRRDTIAREVKDSFSYGKYTLEELLLFKEIHETGIEKWKELHYKQ